MTDPQGCKCIRCSQPATRVLERAELGFAGDRITVCDAPECQPEEGDWSGYAIDPSKMGEAPS